MVVELLMMMPLMRSSTHAEYLCKYLLHTCSVLCYCRQYWRNHVRNVLICHYSVQYLFYWPVLCNCIHHRFSLDMHPQHKHRVDWIYLLDVAFHSLDHIRSHLFSLFFWNVQQFRSPDRLLMMIDLGGFRSLALSYCLHSHRHTVARIELVLVVL